MDSGRGHHSSVGSMLGSLSCLVQVRTSSEPRVEEVFPLELTWVRNSFPKTSDESINQELVCALHRLK